SRESDPSILAEGLLTLAHRLESRGQTEVAFKIYSALQQLPDIPGMGDLADAMKGVAKRAEAKSQALFGQGPTGARCEFLLRRLGQDATDYRTILPMMAGSFVGALTEAAVLGRLAGSARNAWLTHRWAPRVAAAASGFLPEFLSFGLLSRALADHPQGSLSEELGLSALSLGALRLAGFLGNQAFLRLHGCGELGLPPRLLRLEKFNRFALPQLASFAGLLVSRHFAEGLGLRQKTDDATTVTDTLAAMLSLGLGSQLGHAALGPR